MYNNSTKQSPKHTIENRSISRRDFISTSLKAGAAAFTTSLIPNLNVSAQGQHNVLFIMVDDLRPLLGCYGHPEMHTPNIDRLAERGTLFNRAYCQYPVCNPSRASILTGLRPETNGVEDNTTDFRVALPDVVSLPQHFKNHGYHSRSIGKVGHGRFAWDDHLSWSRPIWHPRWRPFQGVPSWRAFEVNDDELEDGQVAQQTMKVLNEVRNEQFFLAVGFIRPHLPFYAPSRYFDLYDPPNIANLSDINLQSEREIRSYSDIPSGNAPLSKEKLAELIWAYRATISYMDAQTGLVLNHLDELNLTDNTVVIFCGDHGYHLGEHDNFGKRTVHEISLHSPLIVSIPGQKNTGHQTNAIVELVDIFPTLCDACNIPILNELEGISMLPVIREPTLQWKSAAFSKIGKENGTHSIRTEQYRYSEFGFNGILGKALYNHYVDPNEEVNLAEDTAYKDIVTELRAKLRSGWMDALPNIPEPIDPDDFTWDVNDDGIVDIQDLTIVAESIMDEFHSNPKADVNRDGIVDIIDLLLVAAHYGESIIDTAPVPFSISLQHVDTFGDLLLEARNVDDNSEIILKGIANLETLMNSIEPKESVLLPNFPNPFNPETWIPYDLVEDAHVHFKIYNSKGETIRTLNVGFQTAGAYRSTSRAAHWDGRNSSGELVSSGVYFYTIHAGKMKSTRQMVVKK